MCLLLIDLLLIKKRRKGEKEIYHILLKVE